MSRRSTWMSSSSRPSIHSGLKSLPIRRLWLGESHLHLTRRAQLLGEAVAAFTSGISNSCRRKITGGKMNFRHERILIEKTSIGSWSTRKAPRSGTGAAAKHHKVPLDPKAPGPARATTAAEVPSPAMEIHSHPKPRPERRMSCLMTRTARNRRPSTTTSCRGTTTAQRKRQSSTGPIRRTGEALLPLAIAEALR